MEHNTKELYIKLIAEKLVNIYGETLREHNTHMDMANGVMEVLENMNIMPQTLLKSVYIDGKFAGAKYVFVESDKIRIASDIFEGMPYPGIYRVNWEDCDENH